MIRIEKVLFHHDFIELNPFLHVDQHNKISIVLVITLASLSVWMAMDKFAHAQEEDIQDQIEDFITENTGDLADQLTENLDFDKGNFLNTNEEESDALKEAGKTWLQDLINLSFSSKDVAKAGIVFLSPVEMSAILVAVISIAITVFFVLSLLKAIGKHIAVMVIIGLLLVGIFVWFRINS